MVVLVDSYLGTADEKGWWIFSGLLKDVPTVRVTFRFGDEKQAKEMRDSLLKGQVTDCGLNADLIEAIELEATE
jgi:hypothetical protein